MRIISLILAAGEGKRMRSNLPKVLHKIAGRELVRFALDACPAKGEKPIVVIGSKGGEVKSNLGDCARYSWQTEQKGTGHAVISAREYLAGKDGYVAILAGDMPLIEQNQIEKLVEMTIKNEASAGVASVCHANPTGYGRIIRDNVGNIVRIVEEKDASDDEKKIDEVNISTYCFRISRLLDALDNLSCDNAQGEYYLTDCIHFLSGNSEKIVGLTIPKEQGMGVNDLVQLAECESIMRERINRKHMLNGVRIHDVKNAYIDFNVEIGHGSEIYPGNVIQGDAKIGEDCVLSTCNQIESSVIGNNCKVGPNAHVRPGCTVGNNCRIGNFVEIKNITMGDGAKISHLSYCGDGSIGESTNIGCGVIFTNYDGASKHRTEVGNGVFVGCNANLVAPIVVEDGAYVAAGSTLTDYVPEYALAIARARQVNKANWARNRSPKANKTK